MTAACHVCKCPAHGSVGFSSDPRHAGIPDALRGLLRPCCLSDPCAHELRVRALRAARALGADPADCPLVTEIPAPKRTRP